MRAFNELAGNSGDNQWGIGWGRFDLATLSVSEPSPTPVITAADLSSDHAFVADPFYVFDGAAAHVFVEAWSRSGERGEIAVFTVEHGRVVYSAIALSEPFHLSYPFVFRFGADWYMLPEAWEAGQLILYKARAFPLEWERAATLMELDYADPQLWFQRGIWYVFLNSDPLKNKECRVFWSRSLFGPWRPHPMNPVVANDALCARSAGPFVRYAGRLFRFTQDCRVHYGGGVFATEIMELTPLTCRVVPVGFIGLKRPLWARHAFHHLHVFAEGDAHYALFDGHSTPAEPVCQ